MNKNAQLIFEDFLVGFLFFFMLASTVLLFIGGSDTGFDLFNRTIFSEPSSGLDYVYVTVYEDGNINDVDDTSYSFNDEELTISYTMKRTVLQGRPNLHFVVGWEVCDATNCTLVTDDNIYSQTNNGFTADFPALANREYSYTYNITATPYSNCNSFLMIGGELVSDLITESVLDNNYYNINIPYCFYPPTDLSISDVCIPRNDEMATDCVTLRTWNPIVECWTEQVDPECAPYESCNTITSCSLCGSHIEARWGLPPWRTVCDSCNVCETIECPIQQVCNEVGVITESINPQLLRIDLSNAANNVPFKLKIELSNINGEYEELSFDYLLINDNLYPYNTPFTINEDSNLTVFVDLSTAKKVNQYSPYYEDATLFDCENGNIKVSLDYELDEFVEYLNDSNGEFVYEYDNNNNSIMVTADDSFLVFNGSSVDKNVYYIGGDNRVELFTNNYDSIGEIISVEQASLTHDSLTVSQYRIYDIFPIAYLEDDILSGDNFNCQAEQVDVGSGDLINCYCPSTTSLTTYSCASGNYVRIGELEGSCNLFRTTYDKECLVDGVMQVVQSDLTSCTEEEGCNCLENNVYETCSCSYETRTDYLLCDTDLEPKKVVKNYYTTNLIKDVNFTNNVFVENILWCVQ